MIRSMTGYGRGEADLRGQKWVVELRTLNHRFLELVLNLPKRLWALEDGLRKVIKGRLHRGRVEMQLTWEGRGDPAVILKLDHSLLGEARTVLLQLQAAVDAPEPLRLEHFLHFGDMLVSKEREALDLEETWEAIYQAVSQALELLDDMRLAEGAALAEEMRGHLQVVSREASRIADQAVHLPQLFKEKLAARLSELLEEPTLVDETRLAQEVALMAERRDITEELARLDSHLSQFYQTLEQEAPAGRKLEFLLQEILREVNTIGAKAGDLAISQAVLEIKGTLERLREQVQNVE